MKNFDAIFLRLSPDYKLRAWLQKQIEGYGLIISLQEEIQSLSEVSLSGETYKQKGDDKSSDHLRLESVLVTARRLQALFSRLDTEQEMSLGASLALNPCEYSLKLHSKSLVMSETLESHVVAKADALIAEVQAAVEKVDENAAGKHAPEKSWKKSLPADARLPDVLKVGLQEMSQVKAMETEKSMNLLDEVWT